MTSPVTFKDMPSGRVIALIGARPIGEVMPFPGDHVRAHWRMTLPLIAGAGASPMPKPARNVDAAKDALRHEIEDWFAEAGEHGRAIARAMREAR